jgi:hypothetical protein
VPDKSPQWQNKSVHGNSIPLARSPFERREAVQEIPENLTILAAGVFAFALRFAPGNMQTASFHP